jgi:thioredoxin-related protein
MNSRITRIVFIALAGIVFPSLSFSQTTTEIKWMTFEQAVEKNKTEPKKIFIDVYTNWCGWCKRMDASTFKDSAVVNYLNKNFHAIKLNAETKDTIRFQGHEFVYRAENRANEIAISLLNKRMSYPTTVYMDEAVSMLSPVPGYLTAEQIMPILKYYGDNIYKSKTWEDYSKEVMAIPASPAKTK